MIKNSLLLGILLSICASCGDFLEPKSQSEFVPKDAAALNEMLLGSAYVRPDTYQPLNAMITLFDDDVACNENIVNYGTGNALRDIVVTRGFFTWQPDMFSKTKYDEGLGNVFHNTWERYYQLILGANAALDYIDKMTGSVEEINVVKAQAYALRGLYYFYLVNIFGEPYNYNKKALGVPLKLNSGMEDAQIVRNTVEEVYEQVLADLDQAEKYYETLPSSQQFNKVSYRTNLPMVQLLKSRVYLYMENWKQAAIYAKKVIDNWGLDLFNLNSLSGKSGYYQFISVDCPEAIWVFGSGQDYAKFGALSAPALSGSQNFYVVSPELLKGFKAGDLRRKEYILTSSSKCDIILSKTNTGAYFNTSYFGQGLRLPEAYLNLAEAAVMDKDETTALAALNDLREKRFSMDTYKKITGVTGKDLLDSIRQERRLELCFEVHRWFDLRRYGMPSISRKWNVGGGVFQQFVLEEKDKSYVMPIPDVVLDQNKALQQNGLAPERKPR